MSNNTLRLQILMNAVDRVTAPFRSIRAQSQRVAQQIQAQQQKLRELDNVAKRMEGYKKLQQQVSKASNQFDKARERARQLRQAMQQMENPTDEMKEAFKAAQAEAKKLQQRHQRLTEQQRLSSQQLRELGIDTNRLADHERELQQNLNRTTEELEQQRRAAQRLQQQQERLNRARSTYDNTMNARNQLAGTGAGMVATGLATGYLLSKPVSAFAKTEDAATQLKVSMMGAGGAVSEEFEKINSLALKLGDRLPGTTADFQNMMTMLRRQGMSANTILGGLGEATAYLAVQLKMPTDAAAEFAAKMQDATRTSEKDMMQLMDTIQKGFYLGVDSNNMLNGFTKISSAMDILKVKGLEGAKIFAPFLIMADQAGMAGEAAGNAYRKVLQRAMNADDVSDANDALKGAGYKLNLEFTDGNGEFGGLDNLFSQLQKLKNLTTTDRLDVMKTIWGDDAETLQVLTLLMEKGKEGYEEVRQKMDAQADLQTRVNVQLGTLKNLWEAAGGTFTNTLASFAETIAPELKQLTNWLGELAEKTNNWIKANPKLAGWIFKLAAGFSALAIAGGALSLTLAAILGPFAIVRFAMSTLGIRIIPMVLGAFKGLFSFIPLIASPIGLIAAAIIAAAFLIYKYWEPIKAFFIGVWQGLKESLTGVSEGFEPLKPFFAWLGNAFKSTVKWIKEFIQPVKATSKELENATNYGRIFGRTLAMQIKILIWPLKQVVKALVWLTESVSTAASFFSSKWAEAGTKTESTIGRLVIFWGLSLKGIGDAIINSEFANLLKTKAGEALDFFNTKWTEAGANTNNILSQIGLFVSTSLTGILNEVRNWSIESGFKAKFDEVITFLQSLGEQFMAIGKEIAIAIWDGIKNEFAALKNDITGVLKSTFGFGDTSVSVDQNVTTSNIGSVIGQAATTLPMYDSGGFIPSGKLGIVGERGPELVNGPANITSRLKTAKIAAAAAMFATMPIAASQQSPLSNATNSNTFKSVLALTPGSSDAIDSRFSAKSKIVVPAGVPGNENTVAPVTMNTNITINASAGQNATDIAKEVNRILDERERRASARVRSSMRDID